MGVEFDDAKIALFASELRKQLDESMEDAVARGFVRGVRELEKDSDFIEEFWRKGYEQVTQHGRDDVTKSIGRRLLTWLSAVLFSLAIYVGVKAGLIK